MTEILDRIGASLVGLRIPRALEALDHTVRKRPQVKQFDVGNRSVVQYGAIVIVPLPSHSGAQWPIRLRLGDWFRTALATR